MRLSACLGFTLHIVHPAGFQFGEKAVRRSALDYGPAARLVHHDSFDDFRDWCSEEGRRLVLLTTKAAQSGYAFAFAPADVLMVGRETSGVPGPVAERADSLIRVPMRPATRSLNVAAAAAMMMGEAFRQTGGFKDLA